MAEENDPPASPAGQPHLHELVATVSAPTLCLSGVDGQIRAHGAEGLYVNDLRALSTLVVHLDGHEPTALGHDRSGGPRSLFSSTATSTGGGGPDPSVLVERERELHASGMRETIRMTSYSATPLACRLKVQLACDLAGMSDVKLGLRPPEVSAQATETGLRFATGPDVSVDVTSSPAPTLVRADEGVLSWDVTLHSRVASVVTLETALAERDETHRVVIAAGPTIPHLPIPAVTSDDHRVARFVERSVADLDALRLALPDRPGDGFLAAGVPWFFTLFGRDSIWAARLLLPLGTELAAGTLRTLASRQGRRVDATTGEEPGKILHEVRREHTDVRLWQEGETAPLSLPPVYYGTVDATPLWVCLLHDAWRFGLPAHEVEPMIGAMEGCLSWIESSIAAGGGFLSYIDRSGSGLANQGWKDSHDGIQFRDGRLPTAPLALCEVQAYAYEALSAGATLLDAFGRPGAARARELADALSASFRKAFWVTDAHGPHPAVALDGSGAAVDSLTSNIGHLLGTGILDAAEEEFVAERLSSSELDCGYGLRTLAATSAGFNPLSYHCGSVWSHDTAIAVLGLTRTRVRSARKSASALIEGLLAAAEAFEYRMPELFGGHGGAASGAPLPYPSSCRPQAWSAAAAVAILTALIGLAPDVPAGSLTVSPLGTSIRSVTGLRLAGEPLDLDFNEDCPKITTGSQQVRLVP